MQDEVRSHPSPPQASCRFQLLGELRVSLAGQETPRSFTHKIGGLLGYLACFLHRSHPRDLLIELFWPEVDVEAGRASLRSALPLLRRLLEPPGVSERSEGVPRAARAGTHEVGGGTSSLLLVDRQTVRLDPQQVTTD